MDRFIDYFINLNSCDNKIFKIQYGQIYRKDGRYFSTGVPPFKIQYGQTYSKR